MQKTAIIGAGVSGLTCARHLSGAGVFVDVFEKSRGVGGRLATRRRAISLNTREEPLSFDHGAPIAEATTPSFQAALSDLMKAGTAAPWREGYAGVPGMSALLKPWLAPENATISLTLKERIVTVEKQRDGWRLQAENGAFFSGYDTLVIAIPAPQAALLLPTHPFSAPLRDVGYAPCFAFMATFDTAVETRDNVLDFQDPIIEKAVCNSAKPGRDLQNDTLENWVIYSGRQWAEENFETDPKALFTLLLSRFAKLLDAPIPPPIYSDAHRWRYAHVETPLGAPFLFDEQQGLALIGDWCLGSQAEDAFRSGSALAQKLLS